MRHDERLDMNEAAGTLNLVLLQLLRGFADEKGIEWMNRMIVDEQTQPRGLLKEPVEHEGEMTLHFLTTRNEGVAMLFRAAFKPAHHAIHVLPQNTGAVGELIQSLEMAGGILPCLQKNLPRIGLREMIQIPAPEEGHLPRLLRANGDAAALGEGGGLQAKAKSAEIIRGACLAGMTAAKAHGITQPRLGHAAPVIRGRNAGIRPVPHEIDPDVLGSSRDAVVHEIGDGRAEVITESAQRLRQC